MDTALTEFLTKAEHDAGFLGGDLREALRTSNAVTALLILPLIDQAAMIENGIRDLQVALNVRDREGE